MHYWCVMTPPFILNPLFDTCGSAASSSMIHGLNAFRAHTGTPPTPTTVSRRPACHIVATCNCELRKRIRKVCSDAPVNALEFIRPCVSSRFLGCISSVNAMLWTKAHRANTAIGDRPHVLYTPPCNYIAKYDYIPHLMLPITLFHQATKK